jgi:acetolactate synthase-1/2/3 large subunit
MGDSANTGQLVALALKRSGVSHLFTLNGGHIWPILTGATEHGIRIIDVRHEQSAAFAAEGWAKVTRECGVAAVTAGPGVTNSTSALGQALAADSPLFLIGGRSPEARWGMGSLQEMDHIDVVRSLTKKAVTLASADEAYSLSAECMRTALSRRTGPTFMDIPLDTFMLGAADLPEATEHLTPDLGPPPDPDLIQRAAKLIREAKRPAVVAGGNVWWAHAEEELRALVEAAHVPLTVNGMARGMLPPGHPLFVNRARRQTLRDADLVVLVGVPLDFRLNFGQPPVFSEDARLIYIDVDDHRKHRPAEVAIFGDLKAALGALAAASGMQGPSQWLDELHDAEAKVRSGEEAVTRSDASPVHPARLITEVDRFIDQDAIVIGDGGDFVAFAGRLIERAKPGLWVDPGPFGCLGSGPGYAMAAKLAHPDRQVVLLSGDGAFGFSAMEFDTMVRHRIPVVCVIGNNGIWALEKHPMMSMLGVSIAADLGPRTRYDKVVEALGGYGELVDRPDQIRPALERALASGLPACINVICDPGAQYPRSSVLM